MAMMEHILHIVVVAVLSGIAFWMAMRDGKSRILSNRQNLALLVVGIGLDVVLGFTWMDYLMHVVFAFFVFLLMLFPFLTGKSGGGDLKLWVAVSLFMPFTAYVLFLVLLIPTLILFGIGSYIKHRKHVKIPFGIPFSIPFIVALCSTFLHIPFNGAF